MLRALFILLSFTLISCTSISKKLVIDYYPTPEVLSISEQSSKRVVFLYKNKEISYSRFTNLMNRKKGLSFQVIKDASEIEKIGYKPHEIIGIILVYKLK
ncbi:hypothetical protein [Riemerella anatipestifer]|uniref:hypothetical protein n=1 Tax=Riemerella anatipestifer TaxID=34085 RepID=UPI00129DABD3|nr:hypothetical protein [Riemerella anatipestifer]MBT0551174.1 hypothetical protein [Riemerella anatipestifer]MBT0552971.1 hypothetical protein [Riemerella anatipestifer]MCE3025260.1 hypothetical protein [Riemerella anatipestifer]MCU7542531.1 hypothetical protein [Riemerella anatipestifer]MCU7558707.1 hypothetical protein [Riemerella anatipestifer]